MVALYTWGFIRARSLGGNVLPGGKLGGGSLSNTVFLVLHGKREVRWNEMIRQNGRQWLASDVISFGIAVYI